MVHKNYPRLTLWLLLPFLCFAALLPYGPVSEVDLSYVLAPAYKMIHGDKLSEIYFQYDLFLSFIAVIWMKLNLGLAQFPIVGSVSFLAFFMAVYWFANSFFTNKWLSVLLVTSMVVIRLYASMDDVIIFQVSPLRLDLWIILLIVAYKKGHTHWGVGLTLGLLIIFHRNLGLIYTASFAIFILSIWAFDLGAMIKSKELSGKVLINYLALQLKQNLVNIIIIGASLLICIIFMGGLFSASGENYRKYGFGMLPISNISFYYYVPVLLGSLIAFISQYKAKLSEKYFSTNLLIVALAVGNSIYFFGRSHENNILNISAVLVLAVFILFDLLIFSNEPALKIISGGKAKTAAKSTGNSPVTKSSITKVLPVAFVLLTGYFYGDRVSARVNIQLDNLSKSKYTYPLATSSIAGQPFQPLNKDAIKALVNKSDKVFFLDWKHSFYDYYYGDYKQPGFFNPMEAWIFKKDLEKYLQKLLDEHYYLVFNTEAINEYSDILAHLKYNRLVDNDGYTAASKEKTSYILGSDSAMVHFAGKDSISKLGIELAPIQLDNEFTIEMILKPKGHQPDNATLFGNMTQTFNGFKGFGIRQIGANQNLYAFSFSKGESVLTGPGFNLILNEWNYLTVSFGKGKVEIFNNGKLLNTMALGSKKDKH